MAEIKYLRGLVENCQMCRGNNYVRLEGTVEGVSLPRRITNGGNIKFE